jgi:hypothetical protein
LKLSRQLFQWHEYPSDDFVSSGLKGDSRKEGVLELLLLDEEELAVRWKLSFEDDASKEMTEIPVLGPVLGELCAWDPAVTSSVGVGRENGKGSSQQNIGSGKLCMGRLGDTDGDKRLSDECQVVSPRS